MGERPIHAPVAASCLGLVCSHDGEAWPCSLARRCMPAIEITSSTGDLYGVSHGMGEVRTDA